MNSLLTQVGGIELDLPLLYEEVKKHGGMQHVIDKHKWGKIADALHIPKNVSAVRTVFSL